MSCRCCGKVRTSKSCTVTRSPGMPSSAVASRTSRASDVGLEAVGERARRDRERDVADLAAALDEPGHRPAAPELAVVGVRREHERLLPGLDHRGFYHRCSLRSPCADDSTVRLRRLVWRVRRSPPRARASRLPRPPAARPARGARPRARLPALRDEHAAPGAPAQPGAALGADRGAHPLGRVPPPARRRLGLRRATAADVSDREREYVYLAIRWFARGTALRRQDARELPARPVPRRALPGRDVRLPPAARGGQRQLADGGVEGAAALREVPAARAADRPRRS